MSKKKENSSNDAQKHLIPYRLTNDYMFRAVLQKNVIALKYLIACLLQISIEDVASVEILNPIILGESIDEKTCILDLRIELNNNQILNIEMQVSNEGDWPERSLYYLARAFSNLKHGESYSDVRPCIHIGILDFTLFPDEPEFYAEYMMKNRKTGREYSDKFAIRVLDLTQLEETQSKVEYPELYYWAKLFKANTWEEIEMLSKQSKGMQEAVLTLKELTEDERIQQQCEAREMYEHTLASAKKYGLTKGMEQGIQRGMEQGIQRGMEQGIKRGMEQGIKRGMEQGMKQGVEKGMKERSHAIAKSMLEKNYSIQEVSELTGLLEDELKELRE